MFTTPAMTSERHHGCFFVAPGLSIVDTAWPLAEQNRYGGKPQARTEGGRGS